MPETTTTTRPPFQFRCLGPVSLTGPSGSRHAFRTRKQTGLLLLLARHVGRPQGREQLVEMLWSDDEPRAARHSLAQSISLINKTLGSEAIAFAGKDQVCLREGVVWLDVDAFESAAAERRADEARSLWRGNLLEGLWIRRAPQFDVWLEAERQRLQRAHREILHEAVGVERAAGDWAAMRRTAETLLGSDPLDEAAMLAYLESLTLGGDRTLALRRYGEFEDRLRAELNAEPGAPLLKWVKRHRAGDNAPAPMPLPGRVSETTVLPASRPLFGREAEFTSLWDGWIAAQRGAGSFVILEGQAGIGKSALAGKLANQAHVGGGSVCFARCFRTEKSVPFAPVTALLRQLMRLPGFVALGEVWIGELSRLVPELKERYPLAPAPMAIDDSARHRICDATLKAAECVADEQPLLIVVDDIHNADEATLALLHYFGRQTVGQPTLLLCVARAGAAESELERTFFDTARSAGIARFLELGALAPAQTARIAQQILAQRGLEAPDWALARLHEIAQGNPLQIIESAMALPGKEDLSPEAWLQTVRGRLGGAQDSFERTSGDRLNTLPILARQVATVLAVAGRPLSDYELASVGGLPTTELASAVYALEGAHFVRRSGGSLGFAHERYQQSAAAQTPMEERSSIHLRLAELLERSAAENPAARYEVARHYEAAGRLADAATQAMLAANYAGSIGAVRERARALEMAVRLQQTFDSQVASELAACYLVLKELPALKSLCASPGVLSATPANKAVFIFMDLASEFHGGTAGLEQTETILRRLLSSSPDDFPHKLAALQMLMRVRDKKGDYLGARRAARELRAAARLSTDPARFSYRWFSAGYVVGKYYSPTRALPFLEKALRLAQETRNWTLEQACRDGLGAMYKQAGRYAESMRQAEFALALARMTLDPQAESMSLNNLAVTQIAMGEYEGAASNLRQAEQIDSRDALWPLAVYPPFNAAVVQVVSGQIDEAVRSLERWYEEHAGKGMWAITLLACGARAICAVRQRNNADLRTWVQRLKEIGKGSEHAVPERQYIEAAVAWDQLINGQDVEGALNQVAKGVAGLRKTDTDHWLRLQLEEVRMKEYAFKTRKTEERLHLHHLAEAYSAKGIMRECLES